MRHRKDIKKNDIIYMETGVFEQYYSLNNPLIFYYDGLCWETPSRDNWLEIRIVKLVKFTRSTNSVNPLFPSLIELGLYQSTEIKSFQLEKVNPTLGFGDDEWHNIWFYWFFPKHLNTLGILPTTSTMHVNISIVNWRSVDTGLPQQIDCHRFSKLSYSPIKN